MRLKNLERSLLIGGTGDAIRRRKVLCVLELFARIERSRKFVCERRVHLEAAATNVENDETSSTLDELG